MPRGPQRYRYRYRHTLRLVTIRHRSLPRSRHNPQLDGRAFNHNKYTEHILPKHIKSKPRQRSNIILQ